MRIIRTVLRALRWLEDSWLGDFVGGLILFATGYLLILFATGYLLMMIAYGFGFY